jgi:hypothetical protein
MNEKIPPMKMSGVNFTNIMAQYANAPAVILLHYLPTKLCPTLSVQTTSKYAQLLSCTCCAVRQ